MSEQKEDRPSCAEMLATMRLHICAQVLDSLHPSVHTPAPFSRYLCPYTSPLFPLFLSIHQPPFSVISVHTPAPFFRYFCTYPALAAMFAPCRPICKSFHLPQYLHGSCWCDGRPCDIVSPHTRSRVLCAGPPQMHLTGRPFLKNISKQKLGTSSSPRQSRQCRTSGGTPDLLPD